jgi:hypothetical protein
VVDNSDFSANRLTALVTPLILAAGTPPLGGGQFELLSQSLDGALDSPYPCFGSELPLLPF